MLAAARSCQSCGHTVDPAARFCPHCGSTLGSGCSSCGAIVGAADRFCSECGTPTTVVAPVTGGGMQRRVTSVLFADLVGFTTLAESLDAEDVRQLLESYFAAARVVVTRYGGAIEKFIGDAVMAVWGVPHAREDDAERAVRAGLDLVDAVTVFGERIGSNGLQMRVGVVTGEVAANVDAGDQAMVAGDAVNTASRVQGLATPGQVWVDDQTRALAGAAIGFADAGTHALKGKSAPMQLWAASGVLGSSAGGSTGGVRAPLIGRRRDLALVKTVFGAVVEDRRPALIVVTGDAGTGKTRLGEEFENHIEGLRDQVLWHSGRCLPFGDGAAFSALAAAVRGRIGADDGDPDDTVRAKLDASLAIGSTDAGETDWLRRHLLPLLGLPAPGPSGPVTPREDLFTAWLRWFEQLSLAADEPVTWVVDDVQHADDGLLDFVEHVVTTARIPLCVVLLARREVVDRRPSLASNPRSTVIGLGPLTAADTRELLGHLVADLPDDIADELVERAEGNPLFALETVRSIHDQSLLLTVTRDGVTTTRLADGVDLETVRNLAAPASLQILISSRLDLLPHDERAVLDAASVLGQSFTLDALAAVTGQSHLVGCVRELVRRDLLTVVTDRLSAEEGRHSFVQGAVRTVAYRTLSRRERTRLHLRVADHLETIGDVEASTAATRHLRDALDLLTPDDTTAPALRKRLVTSLETMARYSASVGAPADAMSRYREALAIVTDQDEARALRLAAAEVAPDAGDIEFAVEQGRTVAADEQAGASDRAYGIALAADALRTLGREREALDLLSAFPTPDTLDALPSQVGSALANAVSRLTLDYLVDAEAAAPWAERALVLGEDATSPAHVAVALQSYAFTLLGRGVPHVGMAMLELAVGYARQHRLTRMLALGLNNLGVFQTPVDLRAAVAHAREGALVSEQAGDLLRLTFNVGTLVTALQLHGDWDELMEWTAHPRLTPSAFMPQDRAQHAFARAVVALARDEPVDLVLIHSLAAEDAAVDQSFEAIWTRTATALLAVLEGHDRGRTVATIENMIQTCLRSVGLAEDFTHHWTIGMTWLVEAGEWDACRRLLDVVERSRPTARPPLLAAQLARFRGTVAAGAPGTGAVAVTVEADLAVAISSLDEVGAVPSRALTQATLGQWLLSVGREREAGPHLRAAYETFDALRATAWARRLVATTGWPMATSPSAGAL